MIASADNDAVLQPSRNEELAIPEKAQISRAQIWPLPGIQERLEGFSRRRRVAPIAGSDTRPGHPDFADPLFPAEGFTPRIDDGYLVAAAGPATADNRTRSCGFALHQQHFALRQPCGIDGAKRHTSPGLSAGYFQAGFGKAIDRIKSLPSKT